MRLGVHYMRFDQTAPEGIRAELAATARAVDEAGVGWLSVMDHWFQMEQAGFPASDPMLEAYTTLGYLAGVTEQVQLGVLVTGVTYRYPALLAKTVATLDVLSGGRATLGIGAAWYEKEHRWLGVPYPPLKERFERLEEALQIAAQMYDPADDGPYAGSHFQLDGTLCRPLPLQRPKAEGATRWGPEVMVGGSGERKTLRLVAQYADACNLFATSVEEVAHKIDVLKGHCADVGRDPSEIRITTLYRGPEVDSGDTAAFVENMRAYARLGVETTILVVPETSPAEWVRRVVAPAVAPLADLG